MIKSKRKIEGLTTLIMRAKSGDAAAFEELYIRFEPIIMKAIRKIKVDCREDAKQELMLELYNAIQRFNPNTDLGGKEVHRHK